MKEIVCDVCGCVFRWPFGEGEVDMYIQLELLN